MAVGADLTRLSTTQLHELTGRDRAWIKKRLAEAKVEPVGKDGRTLYFYPRDALDAIYDRAKINASEEKARLDRARREIAELELETKRGNLIDRGELVTLWSSVIGAFRARIMAIPAKAAPECHGAESIPEVETIIRDHQVEALEILADLEPEDVELLEAGPTSGKASEASDDSGMG